MPIGEERVREPTRGGETLKYPLSGVILSSGDLKAGGRDGEGQDIARLYDWYVRRIRRG